MSEPVKSTKPHQMSLYFGFAHIPNPEVRDLSSHFAELHRIILRDTPGGIMQDKSLDNLWAAKNCAVAALAVRKEQETNQGRASR